MQIYIPRISSLKLNLNYFPNPPINITEGTEGQGAKNEMSRHGWYAQGKGSPANAIFVFMKQGGEVGARD